MFKTLVVEDDKELDQAVCSFLERKENISSLIWVASVGIQKYFQEFQ